MSTKTDDGGAAKTPYIRGVDDALAVIQSYISEAGRQRTTAIACGNVKATTEIRGALIALQDVYELCCELTDPADALLAERKKGAA